MNSEANATLKGHLARNAELVNTLAKRGVDLASPRSIEHHFWAESHRSGVDLAHQLYRQGLLVLALAPVKTDDQTRDLWNVEAEARQSINEAASEKTAASLVELAARLNCIYDGWGTRV